MGESTKQNEEVVHSVPCAQKDNIAWIKESLNDMWKVVDGNGSGKGMKVDLALTKEHVETIKGMVADIQTKLSSVSEINTELEVQRRVALALEEHGVQNRKDRQTSVSLNISRLSIIFAGIMLVASITLGILNLVLREKEKEKTEQTIQAHE